MTDDLNAPLGQNIPARRRFVSPITATHAAAGLLAMLAGGFGLWVAFVEDPLGGEPVAVAAIDVAPPAAGGEPAIKVIGGAAPSGPADASAAAPARPANTQTVTIIDGSSGKRQEVTIPASGTARSDARRNTGDSRLLEQSRHGLIPQIGPDGTRPLDAYARPVAANATGPRVALVVGGLGIGASGTNEALNKLPAPVTFAFAPYAGDLDILSARSRAEGHEILLQVPMEPFDFPDNDPGPQTLLSALSSEQNVDRLAYLMSRMQGYVGIVNFMGARFTAAEQALAPVMRETSRRGLIYLDDGSSPRSVAAQLAGANSLPFAKADVVIDAAPTPGDIDRALTRLEALARERGTAIGVSSALPVAVDRIAKWAKAAAIRGIVLVPISATVPKPARSS